MAETFANLKSTLAKARITSENNALYQTILGLINAVESLSGNSEKILELQRLIDSISEITLIEVNTSGPTFFTLDTYVVGLTLFKDISGNAAANPIVLGGTVDGVLDPTINTNYGWFGVFKGEDNAFHQWA